MLVDYIAAGACLGVRVYRRFVGLAFAIIPLLIIFDLGRWGFCVITGAAASLYSRLEVDLRHAYRGAGLLHRGANMSAVDVTGRRSNARFTAAKIRSWRGR
ncbi:MAG: hypothetical protein ACRDPL_18000, partial [Propionibacteriaceae bacterium]